MGTLTPKLKFQNIDLCPSLNERNETPKKKGKKRHLRFMSDNKSYILVYCEKKSVGVQKKKKISFSSHTGTVIKFFFFSFSYSIIFLIFYPYIRSGTFSFERFLAFNFSILRLRFTLRFLIFRLP